MSTEKTEYKEKSFVFTKLLFLFGFISEQKYVNKNLSDCNNCNQNCNKNSCNIPHSVHCKINAQENQYSCQYNPIDQRGIAFFVIHISPVIS